MMMHPDISMMVGRERRRDMLAAAERRRLNRQARDAARASRRARRPAVRDSRLPVLQALSGTLLRRVR